MTPRALADTAGVRESLVTQERTAEDRPLSHFIVLCVLGMMTRVVLSVLATSALDRQVTTVWGFGERYDIDTCVWLQGEPLGLQCRGQVRLKRERCWSPGLGGRGSRAGGGVETRGFMRPLGSQMGFMYWRGLWSPE